jgi:hypothetical protein
MLPAQHAERSYVLFRFAVYQCTTASNYPHLNRTKMYLGIELQVAKDVAKDVGR